MDLERGECRYCGGKYKFAGGGLVHHERACLRRQVEEIELAETMARIKLERKAYLLRLARERDAEGLAGPIPFAPSGYRFMDEEIASDMPEGPPHRNFEPLAQYPPPTPHLTVPETRVVFSNNTSVSVD